MADEPKIGSHLIAAVNSAGTPKMLAVSDDSPPRLLVSGPAGASAFQVQGPAADGAAVVGNPVRIAGKDASGNTQDILTETDGILRVAPYASDSTAFARVPNSADGNATPIQSLAVAAFSWLFNGTSYDRGRSGSATSTDPHFGAAKVVGSGAPLTLQASVTKAANFSGTAKTGFAGFTDLIVTLDVTAAERDSANELYDFYITTSDGVSSWDIVHFPQIATTGAKRYTARISGRVFPQEVASVTLTNTTTTLQTDTAGAAQGIRTVGANTVRHGPWGDQINHELVMSGTIVTGITYSITITPK